MDKGKIELLAKVGDIYTPSYPIEYKNLFAGRKDQLFRAFQIIPQKGMQMIIYGDRGVGKTSFANILKLLFENETRQVAKISCNSEDTFPSLWRNVFSKLTMTFEEAKRTIGFNAQEQIIEDTVPLSNFIDKDADITLQIILQLIPLAKEAIIVIDEFDRLENQKFNKKLFTDTIKAISDSHPSVTLIIVGVSDDVASLIQEHESIERNLSQIYMPIMTSQEINEIVLNGEGHLSLKFDKEVLEKIVDLSSGFPHFTHSLCYYSATSAIYDDSNIITSMHLAIAIKQTIDNAHESLRNSYRVATLATKQNIFSEVLYASSVVTSDEYGYFQANDLEPILSEILGKEVKVNNFTFHLGKLCILERGEIFKVTGSKNRHRYKFKNPLMRAFIRLKKELKS